MLPARPAEASPMSQAVPDPAQLAVCSWSLQPTGGNDLPDLVCQTGLRRVQMALTPFVQDPDRWEDAPARLADAGVEIASGMMETVGEDYSTLDAIRRTGGVAPDATWQENQTIAVHVAGIAEDLGLSSVSFHAGFIPHDASDPAAQKLTERVQWLADRFADHGLSLLLETGQESAGALIAFLDAADRPNLAVNFDPANMILYGMGDPIDALRKLAPRVGQAHLKDALPTATPGEWGSEEPLGRGAVPWDAFFEVLSSAGYAGDFCVEREAGDQRVQDVRTAVSLVESLRGA
ncbi:MAG: sugar phosphate isomerase/epimerase family protein [Planctomycetota bacterium]